MQALIINNSPIDECTLGLRSRLINKSIVRLKKYNDMNEENIVSWLSVLEEMVGNRFTNDDERISFDVNLLDQTIFQRFARLKMKAQRPTS